MSGISQNEMNTDYNVVKQHYRNHLILTHYRHDGYIGTAWRGKEILAELDGAECNSVVQSLRNFIDKRIQHTYEKRGGHTPNENEIAQAIENIMSTFDIQQRHALAYHSVTPNGECHIEKLKNTLGLASTTDVILLYAGIAQKICDELGYKPCDGTLGAPETLSILLDIPNDRHNIWTGYSLKLKYSLLKSFKKMTT